MKYPTLKEVEAADRYAICGWYRFLPSPDIKTNEQIRVMDRICERFKDLGGMTPEISKWLGW